MPSEHAVYIGIELMAENNRGRRFYTFAALDHNLRLLAIARGSLADVLAFTGGQAEALVAVNAPRRPNQGLMKQESVRQKLTPPPRPGAWLNSRLAEYQLRLPNIPVLLTPQDPEDCPSWMRAGFVLYAHLDEMDYQPYPCEGALRQSLETHPHADFTALLGMPPFGRDTLEGRLQRQLVLHELGLKLPDPMRFFEEVTSHKLLHGVLPLKEIHPPDELDALAAAYTAWAAGCQPNEVTLLGAAEEGQIVVPVGELKERY
jgi:hypothetical protein